MSELEKKERDAFDGGFAIVDRERLIEEETRVVTPWYKHFIYMLTAPSKMMQENLLCEPPKGNGTAIFGVILMIILVTLIQHFNPQYRFMIYDDLREKKMVAENMIAQQYIVTLVVGAIRSFVGVLVIALIQGIMLQVIKVIAKDKCKFNVLYTVMLLGLLGSLFIQAADCIMASLIGVNYTVFNLASLVDHTTLMAKDSLRTVLSFFSLERLVGAAYLIIGYSLVTHQTKKRAAIRIGILELIILGFSIIFA